MGSLFDYIDKGLLTEDRPDRTRGLDLILGRVSTNENELPIHAERPTWVVASNPERLIKKFVFDDIRQKKAFLASLLDYQEEIKHHALIIVDSAGVEVETYTHNVDMVTELDKELAQFCDELYEDVKYYFLVGDKENE